jgi:uncharacterized protein YneF (UPF0154 family)
MQTALGLFLFVNCIVVGLLLGERRAAPSAALLAGLLAGYLILHVGLARVLAAYPAATQAKPLDESFDAR